MKSKSQSIINRGGVILYTKKEAGLDNWREIAYFACMADLIEPGTAIKDVQKY